MTTQPNDLAGTIAAGRVNPLNDQAAAGVIEQTTVEINVPTDIRQVPRMLRELAAAWHAAGQAMTDNIMSSTGDGGMLVAIQMATQGGAAGIMIQVASPTLLAIATKLDEKLDALDEMEAAAATGWDHGHDIVRDVLDAGDDEPTPLDAASAAVRARELGEIAGEIVNGMVRPSADEIADALDASSDTRVDL